MGPSPLLLLTVFGEPLIMGTSWQLAHLRMMVGPLSFPLHELRTSRYRGESAVCLSSGRRGISPLVSSSVVKFLCHASPVLLRFHVNGSHLFLPWANPGFAGTGSVVEPLDPVGCCGELRSCVEGLHNRRCSSRSLSFFASSILNSPVRASVSNFRRRAGFKAC